MGIQNTSQLADSDQNFELLQSPVYTRYNGKIEPEEDAALRLLFPYLVKAGYIENYRGVYSKSKMTAYALKYFAANAETIIRYLHDLLVHDKMAVPKAAEILNMDLPPEVRIERDEENGKVKLVETDPNGGEVTYGANGRIEYDPTAPTPTAPAPSNERNTTGKTRGEINCVDNRQKDSQ